MRTRSLPLLAALVLLAASLPGQAGDPPPKPAAVEAFWEEHAQLRLGTSTLLVIDKTLDMGSATYHFEQGWFFPVYAQRLRDTSEDQATRVVGFAFAGEGTATLHFPEPRDAVSFANRLVRREIATADELTGFVAGEEHFTAAFNQGIVLTADPALAELLRSLDAVRGGGMEGDSQGASEVYVVVTDRELVKARAQASTAFQTRRALMRKAGLEIEEWLQEDLLRVDLLGEDPSRARWVSDFLLEESHGVKLYEPGVADRERSDRWLTGIRDELGRFDGRYRSSIFAFSFPDEVVSSTSELSSEELARLEGGDTRSKSVHDDQLSVARAPVLRRLSGELLPPSAAGDPTSPPLPPARVEPVRADVEVRVRPARRGVVMRVRILGDLTVKAVGGPIHAFRLDFPRHNAQRATWEVTRLEGEDVVWFPTRRDYDGDVLVGLTEPLAAGEELTLRVDWTDTWSTELARGGKVAGAYALLPELGEAPGGEPWPFEAQISTPVTLFGGMSPAASGVTLEYEAAEDFVNLTVADAGGRRPLMALGDYDVTESPSEEGLPGVRAAVLPQDRVNLDAFPRQAIQTIGFMERMLGAYPHTEVELVQATEDTNLGGQGVVIVGGENYPEMLQDPDQSVSAGSPYDHHPYLEASIVARGIAQQYFGQLMMPASTYDEWLTRSLPEAWAWFYTRAAFGRLSMNARLKYTQQIVEKQDGPEPFYSLTHANAFQRYRASTYYHYGPYVLGWMLRKRIGDTAFFRGMAILAEQKAWQRITTDDLQRAWEHTSGEDLGPFFDWWIHGGYIPELRAEYVETRGPWGVGVRGCVRSDVPFGVLELPVIVRDDWDVPSEEWVRIEDGIGWFEKEGLGLRATVELDPDGLVLASKRKLKKVKGEPCAGAGSDEEEEGGRRGRRGAD